MSSKVTVQEFDTPEQLYATLARVFGEHENGGARWVKLEADGVEVTFFAKQFEPVEEVA